MSGTIRAPAVAGLFYPADPDELRRTVCRFLDRAESSVLLPPKALIVPHAGYLYSGAIAASAYACVDPAAISNVVLMGPAHRAILQGVAMPESRTWQTPVGDVMVDFEAPEKLSAFPRVLVSEHAHLEEHGLEVQLPFLQELLGNEFRLTPLLAGEVGPEEAADLLEALWGGPETLVVVSSDLSHYLPYGEACTKDLATAQAIEALDVRGLECDCACGLNAIAGLVCLAQRRGLRVERLDLRNSGDTAGTRDQVVGYGAFAFYE